MSEKYLLSIFFEIIINCLEEAQASVDGKADIGPPKFQTQVASKIEISEGQSAHFEARLTPTEDPNMKVGVFTFYLYKS
jgi:hypothetical protein